jgi:predicted phosphodiesterase
MGSGATIVPVAAGRAAVDSGRPAPYHGRAMSIEPVHSAAAAVRADRRPREEAVPPAPGGRIAVIADIHGNLAALQAALADIAWQRCDEVLCLGDLVDGGPRNEEVVATLQREGIRCVRGNHDAQPKVTIEARTRSWLAALPDCIEEGDTCYVHVSPHPRQRHVADPAEAWHVFEDTPYRRVFVGHAHEPHLFGQRHGSAGTARRLPFAYNHPVELAADDRYIVSVGAIGYGRDRVGRVRYAIHDRGAQTVELRAIPGLLLPCDRAYGDTLPFP